MAVPRFFLARMASTTPSGLRAGIHAPAGSTSTAALPARTQSRAPSAFGTSTAVMPSTSALPRYTAWEKATVQRTVVGRAVSVMTTEHPARKRRQAIPVARSPAPLTTISMGHTPL